MDNTLDNLFSSDRLIKDVDNLMNSLFWIEALKSQNAKGISEKLNYQLNESETFMKNFVKFTVVLKRILFRSILIKQSNEQKKQLQQERQHNLEQIIQNVCRTDKKDKEVFEYYLNNKYSRANDRNIILPSQFLVECIFLAILDLDDYIGTSSEIQTKLIEWFPEMRISSFQIKSLIESILTANACFKRLINFTKSAGQENRPIILGKRQYVWSINQSFLKPFIRYFYKMYDKRTGSIINAGSETFTIDAPAPLIAIPLTETINKIWSNPTNNKLILSNRTIGESINLNDFNVLFYSWKHKLEQFKLLMQIKHNSFGFSWCDSVILKSNNENIKNLDFIKYSSPLKSKPIERKLKNAQKSEKHTKIKRAEQSTIIKSKHKDKHTKTNVKISKIQLHLEAINEPQQPIRQNHHDLVIEHDTSNEINQDYSRINLKFDEKDCLENLLSNEEMLKLEESKSISSMIADSLVNSSLMNISGMGSNYFNILPVSPSICHSFFNHNEINVAHILGSNGESGVDELFCDDLKLDGDMNIQL